MESHLAANPECKIKKAIGAFLTAYNIKMDFITYEALKKYWYRHRKKKEKNGANKIQSLL